MRIGVLGPLELSDGTVDRAPRAPKPRQLLGYLLLNANQIISSEECITELWGSCPPRSAAHTLRTYRGDIRQALEAPPGEAGAGELVSEHGCYQIVLDPADLDRFAFADLARRGHAAASISDNARAAELFVAALALWRGPALADVPAGPLGAGHLAHLEEERKAVLEQRIEAELRLGKHRGLLDELGALTAANPTHENLHAQFMIALYRSGHWAQACEVFRKLKSRLVDELGIEPLPRMKRLYHAILRQTPPIGPEPATAVA